MAASYSSILLCIVPSAKKVLTAEFGMGSGIALSLLPPPKKVEICYFIMSRYLMCYLSFGQENLAIRKKVIKSMDLLVLVS